MFGGKYKTRDIISPIESSFLWEKKKKKKRKSIFLELNEAWESDKTDAKWGQRIGNLVLN